MNEFNIAVFGCWNTGCYKNSEQKSVAKLIKDNEKLYKFMVILGDNYYATKKTLHKDKNNDKNNIKIVDTNINEMKQGFDCLKDINLEKKLIMGNHDVMNSYDKSCSALKIQLKLPWYDIKFPYSYDLYYLKNGETYETILLIYLDTTVYSKDDKSEKSCYQETLLKSKEIVKTEQNAFITDILSKMLNDTTLNINNVVFFGHEPLFTFKEKEKEKEKDKKQKKIINEIKDEAKDEIKDETTDNKKIKKSIITELLDLLFKIKKQSQYQNKNFYWICADHHIYQNTEIINNNSIIKQWIFGTGGGELDEPPSKKTIEHTDVVDDVENKYTLTILDNLVDGTKIYNTNGISNYGYGEIIFKINDSVSHIFKTIENDVKPIANDVEPIANDDKPQDNNYGSEKDIMPPKIILNQSGGHLFNKNFKNKYLKYKQKYLNLKLKN